MNHLTTFNATTSATMTSREIAELTGKRHDHVLRDIEVMLAVLGEASPQLWGHLPDSYGRAQRVARLPKDLTLTLVTGYSIPLRHKVNTRWMELEAQQPARPLVPTSFREALLLAAERGAYACKQVGRWPNGQEFEMTDIQRSGIPSGFRLFIVPALTGAGALAATTGLLAWGLNLAGLL